VSITHRPFGPLGRNGRPKPLVVGLVASLLVAAVATLRLVSASASGCTGAIALRVAAAPEIAPLLQQVGADWLATNPRITGECINLTIDATLPPTIASSLTVYAGSGIDVAAPAQPSPAATALPAVWVPDSSAWLTRVQAVDAAAFDSQVVSLASSPVVMAMPEPAARAFGWPSKPLQISLIMPLLANRTLRFGVTDPRRDTASLATVMLFGEELATNDDDLPALVTVLRGVAKTASTAELLRLLGPAMNVGPASEQAVLAYDAIDPPQPVVAVPIEPAAPILDYPYAIRSSIARDMAQAAQLFRTALVQRTTAGKLARMGFRGPDGRFALPLPSSRITSTAPVIGTPLDDDLRVRHALTLWSAANSTSRTLALVDETSSMGRIMQTTHGRSTRAAVMQAAASAGLDLFTSDSQVGLWTFATAHQDVLPIADLTPQRKALIEAGLTQVRPSSVSRSELYDTLLAAYQSMQQGYDPTRPNIIVVFTDSGDSDSSALRRERFVQDLQRLADATKPIWVILIGVDVGPADSADLQAIADAVGGGFFPLTSPEQIQAIFIRALLRIGRL
jgi:Ca-activated chloride channel homolog